MKKILVTILTMSTLLVSFFSVAQEEQLKSHSEKYFTNTELVNQDGEKVRFFSDVLKGKTVVIDSFFTTCTSICPVMSGNLQKIQESLGEHVGKDVVLVSITVDPETDTPEQLKAYAKRFNAKPGWIFLTGKKENVQTVLHKLGLNVEDKNSHSNVWLIGNEATGSWKKGFGLANSEELLKVVESVMKNK
jgi:protein SCO1/2